MATAVEPLSLSIDKAFNAALETPAPEPEKPAQAPEQPQPPAVETPKEEPTTPDKPTAPPPDDDSAEPQLLTKEELAEIQKNPELAKAYKLMQGRMTRKAQELAEQRKALEPYQQYEKYLREDPQKAVRDLAKHYGVQVVDAPKAEVQAAADEAVEAFRNRIKNPELKFLADEFAPAIKELVKETAKGLLTPLEKEQQQLKAESAAERAEAMMKAFEVKHPDWKQFDAKIAELGKKFPMGDGITHDEYLETLYQIATKERDAAKQTAETIDRIQKAAAKADSPEPGVATQRVVKAAPKFNGNLNKAVDESLAAALNNERWE